MYDHCIAAYIDHNKAAAREFLHVFSHFLHFPDIAGTLFVTWAIEFTRIITGGRSQRWKSDFSRRNAFKTFLRANQQFCFQPGLAIERDGRIGPVAALCLSRSHAHLCGTCVASLIESARWIQYKSNNYYYSPLAVSLDDDRTVERVSTPRLLCTESNMAAEWIGFCVAAPLAHSMTRSALADDHTLAAHLDLPFAPFSSLILILFFLFLMSVLLMLPLL